MIAEKVKVPQECLTFKYNKQYDILEVFIKDVVPAISDEIYYGIYDFYDRKTDELIGFSIMDYTKRDKKYLKKLLPFNLNFDYIDNNIIN